MFDYKDKLNRTNYNIEYVEFKGINCDPVFLCCPNNLDKQRFSRIVVSSFSFSAFYFF